MYRSLFLVTHFTTFMRFERATIVPSLSIVRTLHRVQLGGKLTSQEIHQNRPLHRLAK